MIQRKKGQFNNLSVISTFLKKIPWNCWISFLNVKLALKLLTESLKVLDWTYIMLDSTLSKCSHSPNSYHASVGFNSLVFRVYINCSEHFQQQVLQCTSVIITLISMTIDQRTVSLKYNFVFFRATKPDFSFYTSKSSEMYSSDTRPNMFNRIFAFSWSKKSLQAIVSIRALSGQVSLFQFTQSYGQSQGYGFESYHVNYWFHNESNKYCHIVAESQFIDSYNS